jgi:hypothetical protein
MKNRNNCWTTKIAFYLETSGRQNSTLYLNVAPFFNNRHLWQLKTVVFQGVGSLVRMLIEQNTYSVKRL